MTLKDFIGTSSTGIVGLINSVIIPVIFAVIFLFFLWGVVKYFFIEARDEKARESGRNFVLWSVLAIAVLLSVWGIVNLLLNTLGITAGR